MISIKNGWIPWFGGACPVPPDTLVEVMLYLGVPISKPVEAKRYCWAYKQTHSNIIAYRVVKENKVEQAKQVSGLAIAQTSKEPQNQIVSNDFNQTQIEKFQLNQQAKQEPAKKPHKHAAMIAEWIKDTSRVVEYQYSDTEWIKAEPPIWREAAEYRFADEAKQECVSPLSDHELATINKGSIKTGEEYRRTIANAAHRAALKWVAELPAKTSLNDAHRISYQLPAQRETAAIAEFQAQLKRIAEQ